MEGGIVSYVESLNDSSECGNRGPNSEDLPYAGRMGERGRVDDPAMEDGGLRISNLDFKLLF